ncbi:MAG: DEAD/DEAH box helicase [Elusimicrobia bacterium]|nr:DEAD/DEAH box helicase [Elusimicrobiota bacterium]
MTATKLLGMEVDLDPFCVEKNLRSWASGRIIFRGRDYYRQKRVLTLESYDSGRIEAQVEGTASAPYRVEIQFDRFGMPVSRCTCPFKFEPLCKHAVAALIAWQQEETGSEPDLGELPGDFAGWEDDASQRGRYLEELAKVEREARRLRCGEQGLRIVGRPSAGVLGVYEVASGTMDRKGRRYTVTVRDADWRHASCGCVDYLTNELGTCKHIERVKSSLGHAGERRLKAAEAKAGRISFYLASRPSHETVPHPLEEIRVHIPERLRAKAPFKLVKAVDRDGYLSNGKDPMRQKEAFAELLRCAAAESRLPLEVEPAVRELMEREAEAFQWERRIEAMAKDPGKHPAWRESAGAMDIKLHPYQVEGILFAAKKRRAFIGDDMGLGKTVEAIGAALLLQALGAARRTLIICPASLKQQWKREIEKVSKSQASIIAGPARERERLYGDVRTFFIIVNYELLYRDLKQIAGLKADLVVLDEAQRIKNWETKIAQCIRKLDSPCRFVLTGTPLENRLAELHSISEYLNPKALGAAWKLMPTYARLDADDRVVGYQRLDHLRARLNHFFIRRTRTEVLSQLPERTDNSFWTPITADQADVQDHLAKQVRRLMNKWERYKRLTKEDMQRLFMLLTCMRMVCNAYGQYDWKPIELEVMTARRLSGGLKAKIGSPKLEEFHRVMADLLETPGQKVVVFSQWERMLRLGELYIRDLLEESGSRSVIFCGALSLKKREAEIQRFLKDPATRVFFSTDAGGVGLNLQEGSSCVVNLEIPWNPSVLEQRIGRVHRMGQKKSVEVVNLISSECVEERIFNLVAQKKALFDGVFDGRTVDIRFDAKQTASFMEKMKTIFPVSGSAEEEPAEDSQEAADAEVEAASDAVPQVEAVPAGPPPPAGVLPAPPAPGVSGAGAPPASCTGSGLPALPAPVVSLDITSALAALAKAAGAPEPPPQAGTVRVSQDGDDYRFSVPKPAVELLKGFRPILEALLKLGG